MDLHKIEELPKGKKNLIASSFDPKNREVKVIQISKSFYVTKIDYVFMAENESEAMNIYEFLSNCSQNQY